MLFSTSWHKILNILFCLGNWYFNRAGRIRKIDVLDQQVPAKNEIVSLLTTINNKIILLVSSRLKLILKKCSYTQNGVQLSIKIKIGAENDIILLKRH